jgi:predicted flavoprotein YhiN
MVRKHGVELKIEEDGRMFPFRIRHKPLLIVSKSNSKTRNLSSWTKCTIYFQKKRKRLEDRNTKRKLSCRKLILATGSNQKVWEMLQMVTQLSVVPSYSLSTSKIPE